MKKLLSSPYTLSISIFLFILCSYWIYKNVKLDDLIGKESSTKISDISDKDSSIEYQILGDDIVKISDSGDTEIVIKGSEVEDLVSISDLSTSPDEKRLCFLVKTIVPTWLYVYDIEEGTLDKVALAKNCLWSPDGNYIAYNNHTTDVSSVDVFILNLESGDIKNLTEGMFTNDYISNFCDIHWENENEISITGEKISISNVTDIEGRGYVFDVKTGQEIYVTSGPLNCE